MAGTLERILAAIQRGTHTPVTAVAPTAPAAPVASVSAQTPGIMSTIGSVLAPEDGSFWANALEHGLAQARPAMAEEQRADAMAAEKQRLGQVDYAVKQAELKKAADPMREVGGALIAPDGAGGYKEVYRPKPQTTETERLIDMIRKPDTPADIKDLIDRVLRGYQYTPEVIEAQGRARTATAVAAKQAQKFAPRAARSSSSGVVKAPAGFFKVTQ